MALKINKTTSYALTCKKCQHPMTENENAYVCSNCGNTVNKQEIEASLHEALASGTAVKSHIFSFSKPYAQLVPFQPLSPGELQPALTAIRKTGSFAITLGSIDLLLALAGLSIWLSNGTLKSASLTMVTSIWGAQALLFLITGYIVKQVGLSNARRTANTLSLMGFGLGALMLLSLLQTGRESLIEILHLLIFGSIIKSLKLAKRLQIKDRPSSGQ